MKTGIYQIRNLLNGDLYIGSAQLSFYRRNQQHWSALRKGNHHSIHLQRAVNRDGLENFVFEVIEECIVSDCLVREQHFIDLLKPSYNICKEARSRKGIKITDPIRLEKCRLALAKGRANQTDESRAKMSMYHRGRKKTKEHAMKVGTASKKKILQYDLQDNFVKEWNSVKEAEMFYNGRQGSISRVLSTKDRHKTFRGFKWKYKDINAR